MAEKTFNNVRFQFLYDTYDSWKTKNPTLKAGEIAIATIPSGGTPQENSTVTTPQVLIKVGDGSTPYNTLPFISGRAADVYSWAKASTKPTYTANEITNLGTFIGEYLADQDIVTDTDTQYRIVQDTNDQNKFTLQSKAKGAADSTFATVSTITIPKYDDSALVTRLTNVEGTASAASVKADALVSGTTPAKRAEKDADGNVITITYATKTELNDVEEVANANTSAIAILTGDSSTAGSVDKKIDDAIKTFTSAYITSDGGAIDKLQEIANWIDSDKDGAADIIADVEANATEITNIKNGTTTVPNAQSAVFASSATRANQDTSGNVIVDTYATKTELSEVAKDVEANAVDIAQIRDGVITVPNAANATYASTAGTATTAEKATQDGDGNTITTTYAKNDDLAAIAKTGNVNDLVQTTGDVIIFKCGNAASISNS